MKKTELSIFQRMIAVTIYVGVFVIACRIFSQNWLFLTDSSNSYNIIFLSGALLLILGTYIAEPFFTKPTDVLANSIAVILALLSVNNKSEFVGYWHIFYSSVFLGISAVVLFFLYYFPKTRKLQQVSTEVLTKAGQSKVLFSAIYVATLFSYFKNEPIQFTFFLTFWIVFITNYAVEHLILWATSLLNITRKKDINLLGEAIGCDNPFLYTVEMDYFKHNSRDAKYGDLVYLATEGNCGYVGIIIEEKYLLNKKWITTYLLQDNNLPIKINLKNGEITESSKSIFSANNYVYSLQIDSIENSDSKKLILNNSLYKNRHDFVGYVAKGSNISKIKFVALVDSTSKKFNLLQEGSVITAQIKGRNVLYQIIDGETLEEELEKHNLHGYLTGVAQKLGVYDEKNKEILVAKWVPNIYSPIFFDNSPKSANDPLKIGFLPETNLQITLKDVESLVTHNTAILGILGIGKSCLTFELIKKSIENTDVRVICIDITNEYKKELNNYIDNNLIQSDDESIFNEINSRFEFIHSDSSGAKNYEKSGNQSEYRTALHNDLVNFFFGQNTIPENKIISGTNRIRIFNPDYHKASKGEKIGFNVIASELSQAEKTRIISEEIFKIMMKLELSEEKKAKVLIVLEEAHSLVPEWNSTANEGDKSAVNGTAKIILQGRKYGLGSLIITQRTANISKSILNQCNTIFALRVFDDTGKQFLENYIGSDYSNTLPTLAERHAIVVGKALKLKQPVIVRLNDQSDVISKESEASSKSQP